MYETLQQKITVTVKVWLIPTMGAMFAPIFILIGMGIIFRQEWARLILVIISAIQLLFVAGVIMVAVLFDAVWVAKNFGAPYHDEFFWFFMIPALCVLVFTRRGIRREFH